MYYINPFTDFGFKKLFGVEPNKDILIAFLNSLLPAKHQVADLEYRNTAHLGQSETDRADIFDLYCVSANDERFIVELQNAKQVFFKERSVFYSTFPLQDQGVKGEWNYNLHPVYLIAILNFTLEDKGQVYNEVKLFNISKNNVLSSTHCKCK
jgi:predicted transposase/invertase (TIGR01784 family)